MGGATILDGGLSALGGWDAMTDVPRLSGLDSVATVNTWQR